MIIVSGCAAFAQTATFFPLSHYKLKNGLEIILAEDFSLPLVSVAVAYNVGAVNESPGKTGLVYLMENLMFSGSANVASFQHINYISRVGGRFNAEASEDKTLFYQTVPSNQLALVLWLESDRMKSLELSEAAFERARNAHIEDLRERRTNEPYLESSLSFDRLLYADFAHGHPLLGSEEDVRNLTLEDAKNFYAGFYVPNNAVLCITGNFNKLKARQLVAMYFETIPRGKDILPISESFINPKKQTVQAYEDPLAPSPAFHLGFRIDPPAFADYHALAIFDYVLLRGRSSRLMQRLLNRNNRIAIQVTGGIEKKKSLAAYKIFGTVNNEAMADICIAAIFSELDKLRNAFLSDAELTRYKNMFKQDYLTRLSTPTEKAIFLCEQYLSLENFDDLPLELDKYMNVSKLDIISTLNRFFKPNASVILNVRAK